MQFEEFDNKIREAANHHYPAYDENAWSGMEKLLNKHLPREDDNRRRIIFLLFLFLLLGAGGVWLFSNKPWKGVKQTATANASVQKPAGDHSLPVFSKAENPGNSNDNSGKDEISSVNKPLHNSTVIVSTPPADQPSSLLKNLNKNEGQFLMAAKSGVKNKKIKNGQETLGINNNPQPVINRIDQAPQGKDQMDLSTRNTNVIAVSPDQSNKKTDVELDKNISAVKTGSKPVVDAAPVKENANKENEPLVQNSPPKKTKDKNKTRNNFFFSFSTGPDISATGGDKLGKIKLLAGAGLGFTYKDRLTIRSGFYTGRKIYTSSPASYHPPANFWNYYPNLEKVDADCKVYEIPLSLSYHFGHSSKQNLFVSAGMSSYLMKKETYNYYYKYNTAGPTIEKKLTIQNKNKHYFSVLTLSGGFQKNIGRSIAVMVEPYYKLPLGGVGFGKVKLSSGGVLLSVAIKPFAKK